MSKDNAASTMIKVSPKTMRKHALNCIGADAPFFVWGNPGIGKSEILRALVEKLGYHFEDIRLSQIESVDLRGLPVKQEKVTFTPILNEKGEQTYTEARDESGQVKTHLVEIDGVETHQVVMVPAFERHVESTVVWAMPDFLRRAKEAWENEGKRTAYFFDELNSGSPATMAAAYQFINDRRIGSFELGKGDIVFAAGNLESDGGVTNSMPLPLANRFRHYIMEVNTTQWLDYASENGIHPFVVAYLSIGANSGKLQDFAVDRLLASDEKSYATPRTWRMLSKALYMAYSDYQPTQVTQGLEGEATEFNVYDEVDPINENDISVIAASCVGSGIAVEFSGFVKEGMSLPKARDILDGKTIDATFAGKPSAQYFMANDCSHSLKEMKAKLDERRKELGEKSPDYITLVKAYVKCMENYIVFAKDKFDRELFVYGVITVMLKRYKVVPLPQFMSKPVFALISTEFNKAKLDN